MVSYFVWLQKKPMQFPFILGALLFRFLGNCMGFCRFPLLSISPTFCLSNGGLEPYEIMLSLAETHLRHRVTLKYQNSRLPAFAFNFCFQLLLPLTSLWKCIWVWRGLILSSTKRMDLKTFIVFTDLIFVHLMSDRLFLL